MNVEVVIIIDELTNSDIEIIEDYNKTIEYLNGEGNYLTFFVF